jgi:hypothetical protein
LSLHPELARLEQQYFTLAEDLRLGHVTESDALQIMGNLSAVDGEGAVWSIDPYSGDFVRGFPGSAPQPADPGLFVPAQLPPVSTPVLPHGTHPGMVSEFQHPALRPLEPEPRSKKALAVVGGAAGGIGALLSRVVSGFSGLLKGRGRTVLVVLGFVVFALLLIGRAPSSGKDDSGDTDTGAATSVPVAPPVSVPDIVLPGEQPAPQPPSAEKLSVMLTALASGDAAALKPFLPEAAMDRWPLAALLGAPRLGLQLTAAAPVVADGSVTIEVKAGDPAAPKARWQLRVDSEGRILSASTVAG